jgi:hypothetical protein
MPSTLNTLKSARELLVELQAFVHQDQLLAISALLHEIDAASSRVTFASEAQIDAARKEWASDDLAIDDNARYSSSGEGGDPGHWIEAWVWMPAPEIEVEKDESESEETTHA